MATLQQSARINDALHEIHKDISGDLNARRLANIAAYSEQHFHRLFHEVVGEPVHAYIRRTRLEHSANQLMFDPKRPVLEIAEACGFSSLSSFSKAFKATFDVTPGQWRVKELHSEKPTYLSDNEIAAGYSRIQNVELPIVNLMEQAPKNVAYVRHLGYNRSIRQAWQTLQVWSSVEGRKFDTQLGLHHSNPVWVPLEQCRYVACIEIDRPIIRRGVVNGMTIPGGLHATFNLSGKYGELLPYISRILDEWLPTSGFRAKTTPAFVEYQKNHFLSPDEHFDLTFYLPISLW